MTTPYAMPHARLLNLGRRYRLPALLFMIAVALGACAAPEKPPEAPAAPPPPVPAPAPPPEAEIILDPHGRMIVEAMEYPWSAIGRINAGGRNHCTGLLIGPDLVLGPAACLYNRTEGRWWAPAELHFVAGYQRDRYPINAGVAGYRTVPGFDGRNTASLANLTRNWAVLSLDEAIGYRAGWLGLQWLDAATRARIARGEGLALKAGYRRGWAHAITMNLGCASARIAPAGVTQTSYCPLTPADPELPVLVFLDQEVRVLGDHFLPPRINGGDAAGDAFAALPKNGARWGDSRAPRPRGPAKAVPRDTAGRLLVYLGYLETTAEAAKPARRAAAIRRFERAAGLPVTGKTTLALLGRLIAAARAEHTRRAPGPKASMVVRP